MAHDIDPSIDLTPYLVNTDRPRGAVVVLPGGGYTHLAEHEGEPVARRLNEFGIHALVLRYPVAPARHPDPLNAAARAVRVVRHHADSWNVLPQKVGILGFSAGGHLASTLATHFDAGDPASDDPVARQSSRPDAALLCYPVISFGEYRHNGSMVNLLGEPVDETLRQSLSNETQVTAETPPCFLWHTSEDRSVPVQNSLDFARALAAVKVPFELHVFPHGGHGLGLAVDDEAVGQWSELCGRWLVGLGF